MNGTTYKVRFHKTKVYKGTKVTTYYVRWVVDGQEWQEPFRSDAQADSFRSELVTAARKGEAFAIVTGRPVAWQRAATEMTWYQFACKYADMKWKDASAKYRRDIARALTAATPAMFNEGATGKPVDAAIRTALRQWAFNTKQREAAPAEVTSVLAWIERNTAMVSTLANAVNARRVLDAAMTNADGKRAAPSTARRHRTILANALDYARELRAIEVPVNPIRTLKWQAPKASGTVDRRCVVNPRQARALLTAVRAQKPSGTRLVAFFGTMYFAAARPEEAINLAEGNITFPPIIRNEATRQWEISPESDGWGELEFEDASPDTGREWTDDGDHRERRQLKHRAPGETRPVPMCPELSLLLWRHVQEFGTAPDGKLFTGIRGGELPTITYRRAWTAARQSAFTAAECASLLARRPYDLRHACLSTWLNGGVPPTQVAEWAGHGVDVLLRIYAKCIVGQDAVAKRRITEALRDDDATPAAEASRQDDTTATD
jgi:integrase